jgi:hypothetical protein
VLQSLPREQAIPHAAASVGDARHPRRRPHRRRQAYDGADRPPPRVLRPGGAADRPGSPAGDRRARRDGGSGRPGAPLFRRILVAPPPWAEGGGNAGDTDREWTSAPMESRQRSTHHGS